MAQQVFNADGMRKFWGCSKIGIFLVKTVSQFTSALILWGSVGMPLLLRPTLWQGDCWVAGGPAGKFCPDWGIFRIIFIIVSAHEFGGCQIFEGRMGHHMALVAGGTADFSLALVYVCLHQGRQSMGLLVCCGRLGLVLYLRACLKIQSSWWWRDKNKRKSAVYT